MDKVINKVSVKGQNMPSKRKSDLTIHIPLSPAKTTKYTKAIGNLP